MWTGPLDPTSCVKGLEENSILIWMYHRMIADQRNKPLGHMQKCSILMSQMIIRNSKAPTKSILPYLFSPPKVQPSMPHNQEFKSAILLEDLVNITFNYIFANTNNYILDLETFGLLAFGKLVRTNIMPIFLIFSV